MVFPGGKSILMMPGGIGLRFAKWAGVNSMTLIFGVYFKAIPVWQKQDVLNIRLCQAAEQTLFISVVVTLRLKRRSHTTRNGTKLLQIGPRNKMALLNATW